MALHFWIGSEVFFKNLNRSVATLNGKDDAFRSTLSGCLAEAYTYAVRHVSGVMERWKLV